MFIKKLVLIASLVTTNLYTASPRQYVMTDKAEPSLNKYPEFNVEKLNQIISFQEKCNQRCCSCTNIMAASLATCFFCPSATTAVTTGLLAVRFMINQEIKIAKLSRENNILRDSSRM